VLLTFSSQGGIPAAIRPERPNHMKIYDSRLQAPARRDLIDPRSTGPANTPRQAPKALLNDRRSTR